ncbi:hypothetical protein NDU88_005774 [Pleurodeles waltl]|uniref:Uncharacterized protein n=1 Tax=Pleurodeles waltl TaxID=8319 RepID=A0AAV7W8S6_PLEWA|nr:hypothetical protein NDU88_005774 [Pleurodeles waltl]
MRGGNHGITCPNQKAEPETKPKRHQAKEPHPAGTKGPKKTQKIRWRSRRSTKGPTTPRNKCVRDLETNRGITKKMHPDNPLHLGEPHITEEEPTKHSREAGAEANRQLERSPKKQAWEIKSPREAEEASQARMNQAGATQVAQWRQHPEQPGMPSNGASKSPCTS